MKRLRTYKDIEHQLELTNIQRGINLDKLKGGIKKTKEGLFPSLLALSLKSIFKKKRKWK